MKIKHCYIIFFVLFSFHTAVAQEEDEELKVTTEEVAVKKKKRDRKKERREKRIQPYEPLAPARAAFYSAVLPGLGQAYTKKYWKIPIVYAAIGTGIYFYLDNNRNYNDFRDIFKRRLAGFTDDRFINQQTGEILVSNEQLISLQERFRRDQELSLLLTVAAYLLNIVDANVTAHLQQYNITDDLSLKPGINFNEFDFTPNYGVTLNFNF
ncbi:DUF5683 domain-containing protein [Aquimarina spongiae]|uniref:DUF5683 domain-containing protein n=1 Tax=Aquimarina spongiae TaxID=570521 RepID=A0A1M6CYI5_9FLAO|nr:DUF5683 domain-containing protein [Aquimarina spongiae]SHI66039.1 hypothetical protein SAMN04488508_102347 [Aquimarina spongiae]